MSELLKTEKKDVVASGVQPQATDSPVANETKPEKSIGEKRYDWLVYKGLNYWVNLGSSIVIADYFRNLGGKKLLEKGARALSGGNEKIFNQVHPVLKTLTLLSGGWLLVIPVKMLEDRKREAVHWLNEKSGVDQRAPDGHKMTPDEIYIEQEQPVQSWARVLGRRLMATGAVLTTGFAVNHAFKEKGSSKPNGEEVATDFVVKNVNKLLKKMPGADKLTREGGMPQRLLSFVALDAGYTKITEVVMHKTNGAKKEHLPNEIEPVPATANNTAQVVKTETPQAQLATSKLRGDPAHKKILNQPHIESMSERIAARQAAENAATPSV